MKAIVRCLLVVAALGSGVGYCGNGFVSGKVQLIRSHHDASSMKPPKFWFTLEGVLSGQAGGCPSFANGNIQFMGNTEYEYSLVMMAYSKEKYIAVRWVDSDKVDGFCLAKSITIGNPPPLY